MPSFNQVVLVGNLTRDPELKYTPSGAAVCEFSIAINRKWNDKAGQKREEVGYFDCTAWARTAELCAEFLKKGRPVLVNGRLTQNRWETPDGQKRSRVIVTVQNIQFLGGKNQGAEEEASPENVESADDSSF